MEISGASVAAQAMQTNRLQSGYDVLTRTTQKAEQNETNEQMKMEIAEQTGKGMNIDVKA